MSEITEFTWEIIKDLCKIPVISQEFHKVGLLGHYRPSASGLPTSTVEIED